MILKNVPIFKQKTSYTCGPASLKIVLAFLGKRISEAKLTEAIKPNKKTGSSRANLIKAAQEFGFLVKCGQGKKIDHKRFLSEYQDGFFALFKTEAPAAVARGKLESLVNSGQIPKEALLLAVDTMPQFFPETEKVLLEAVSMERPETVESAKQQMIYVFRSIVRDYVSFRDFLHFQKLDMMGRKQPDDKISRTVNVMWFGRLSSCVKVNTGIAIRPPNSNLIKTSSEEINIYPQVLYDMVDQELGENYGEVDEDNESKILSVLEKINEKTEQLADSLISLQAGKALQVSGGIDYSDPKVRSLLKARVSHWAQFISEEEIDPRWFQGMPVEAIKDCLQQII